MFKRAHVLAAAVIVLGLSVPATSSAEKSDGETKCRLRFNLSSWSVFYKRGKGDGTITCDNGQSAKVKIEARGGGLTAGKSKIREGKGQFSEVEDISEVFGSYAQARATAGAVKSAEATAMTKGEVSLALAGKGTGWELGVSFGKFSIIKVD